jgi:hypothetical protein
VGLFSPNDQLTIGWNTSSIVVDAGVSGQQVFVVLKWEDVAPTQGIWSFQIDITSTTITIGTGSVALYGVVCHLISTYQKVQ